MSSRRARLTSRAAHAHRQRRARERHARILSTGPAAVFAFAPNLAMPLFNGAHRANLEYTVAQTQGLVASYALAIQSAFRDVADALATRATIEEQLAAQASLVEAATKGFELAQARYQAGVDPFLATLVSQSALYGAKNALVARSSPRSAIASRSTACSAAVSSDQPRARISTPIAIAVRITAMAMSLPRP
jgi:outer membrane protein TolC